MSSLLIQNPACVATMNDRGEEFSGGHLFLEDGIIRSLGPEPFPGPADETIDASTALVVPGFVNTHHHFYQTLTRNIPRMQDEGLFPWLQNHYEVWRELDARAFAISARVAMLELMQSGVTTSSDHLYLFPREAGSDLIDTEIEAARDLGLRFHPTRGSMSRGRSSGGLPPDDVIQTEEEIRVDILRLLDSYHETGPGAMIQLALAPCSPFSVTPELMRWTADFAGDHGLGIHTHLAETLDEEAFCLQEYGQRPIAYAKDLGWLREGAWFAHSVHVNDEEIQAMGTAGVGISHCPSSNMRLGSGIAPIREMLEAGVKVSLGVDGSASNDSSDMLLEMRNALLLSRLREKPNWLTAREVLHMATRGGAEVLGREDIGSLEVDQRADLALFQLDGIAQAGSLSDPVASLVFTTRRTPVDWLIIEGQVRIREGRTTVDEEALAAEQNAIAQEVLKAAIQRTGVNFQVRD